MFTSVVVVIVVVALVVVVVVFFLNETEDLFIYFHTRRAHFKGSGSSPFPFEMERLHFMNRIHLTYI